MALLEPLPFPALNEIMYETKLACYPACNDCFTQPTRGQGCTAKVDG